MDLPDFSHDGEHGYPTERRPSHWQPALRPNGDETPNGESQIGHGRTIRNLGYSDTHSSAPSRIKFNKLRGTNLVLDGEDERLDPAWGIRRVDSAHILESVQRSPSFPEFALSARDSVKHTFPQPTIATSTFGGNDESAIFADVDRDGSTGVHELRDPVMTSAFDNTEGLQLAESQFTQVEQTSNARYEEGLPLIPHPERPQIPQAEEEEDAQGSDAYGGNSSSSSLLHQQLSENNEATDAMPKLDRKSTADVLKTLDVDRERSTSPHKRSEKSGDASLDNAFGGGTFAQAFDEVDKGEEGFFSQTFSDRESGVADMPTQDIDEVQPEDAEPPDHFLEEEAQTPLVFSEKTDYNDDHSFDPFNQVTVEGDEVDDFTAILATNRPENEDGFFSAAAKDGSANDFPSAPTGSESNLPDESASSVEKTDPADTFAQIFGDSNFEDVDAFAQVLGSSPLLDEDAFAQAFGEDNSADADAMWKAAIDEDDEFLVEDADDLLPDSDPGSPASFKASMNEGQAAQALPRQQNSFASTSTRPEPSRQTSNAYAPHQPSTMELTQLSPKTHGNVGFTRPGLPPMNSFQAQLQRPEVTRAASYADQTKGGYKSPYDLPMDLAKPKKRPQAPRIPSQLKSMPPPPPRSSSISAEKHLQSPFTPTNSYFGNNIASPPAQPPVRPKTVQPSLSQSQGTSGSRARPAPSAFFEELPMVPRTRPTPGPGRYTPSQPVSMPPPPLLPLSPVIQEAPSLQQPQLQSPPQMADPYAQFQLQPPAKLDPYANIALQPASTAPTVAQASRYSPAPPTLQSSIRPSPSPRYSPAPPPQQQQTTAPAASRYATQPHSSAPPSSHQQVTRQLSQTAPVPPPTTVLPPFQPRTSSPLVNNRDFISEQNAIQTAPPAMPRNMSVASQSISSSFIPAMTAAPVLPTPQPASHKFSPPRRLDGPGQPGFEPPRRSQTQSPGQQVQRPSFPARPEAPLVRPMSAIGTLAPVRASTKVLQASPPRSVVKAQRFQQQPDFTRPTDESQFDNLNRWQGAPVFRFGFGGSITSSFPKHTPRYSAGSTRPQIKPSVGEIGIRKIKDVLPIADNVASFPGPLRAKSKKKDVLNWLTTAIKTLESDSVTPVVTAQAVPDPQRRQDEKLILWKIVRVMVENDGVLDNANALQAVNTILMPEVHILDEASATQYRSDDHLTGIYRPSGANVRTESTDPLVVENLRKHLLRGKREDAVWLAVDNRLWSHALLIASTLEKTVWKQVVQEFVRQEVKTVGENAESLSALYEIFGGNVEESIDQLVPPSARAGLQMVRKVESAGPIRNALDGLDRWKETLSLVLNNRSPDDQRALATLGKLLADYGRIEASHICYMFSRSANQPTLFGGADEPQSSIVLLGADDKVNPLVFHHDIDAIMLTEVYEFAMSILAGSASTAMPHLCVYKLQRANELAEAGMKNEAQAYCDAIVAGLKSNTKLSPYYHPVLLGEVEELTNRLKQAPVQSSSWIAKPSIEKVSGSVWTKFTSFVAGDDSDAESKGSGRDATEAGPFANVSGSPSLSRTASQTDIYGSYPVAPPTYPSTAAGSRYAPNGAGSARSSLEMTRGRPSIELQRSPPSTSYGNDSRPAFASMLQQQYQPSSPYNSMGGPIPATNTHRSQTSLSQTVRSSVDESRPILHQQNSYQPRPVADNQSLYMSSEQPVVESAPMELAPIESTQISYGGYSPPQTTNEPVYEAQPEPEPEIATGTTSTYEPSQPDYGYQPPEADGYVPYEPEPDSDSEQKPKPKKKSFMDDDDEEFTRISQAPKAAEPIVNGKNEAARKKANDEAAEAAFRAAAEADAASAKESDQQKKASGSWLGGWFAGGKKTPDGLDNSSKSSKGSEAKIYKAKLGESKMKLYYDKDLKKWVNPDNPDASTPKSTPPPPRGGTPASGPPMGVGPPRSVSNLIGSGPPSRSGTPAGAETDGSRPGSSNISAALPPNVAAGLGLNGVSTPPPPGAGVSTPPIGPPTSRPTSSTSNTGGLDDLLGAPSAGSRRAGGRGAKAKKGGRYVDIMQQ